MATIQQSKGSSQAAIFARLWESKDGTMPLTLARQIVKLRFPKRDQVRMHQLAQLQSEGLLSPAELEEFDNYIRTGDLLALLQSMARQTIRRKTKTAHHE